MKRLASPIIGSLALALLNGCSTPTNLPLVFGQSHAVGISVGGNATEGGADITIGYRDRDIAVVPVTVQQEDGSRTQLEALTGADDSDAFSVLGQFSAKGSAGTESGASLGKFFATGIAARRLADGFACTMGACPEGNDPATDAETGTVPDADP